MSPLQAQMEESSLKSSLKKDMSPFQAKMEESSLKSCLKKEMSKNNSKKQKSVKFKDQEQLKESLFKMKKESALDERYDADDESSDADPNSPTAMEEFNQMLTSITSVNVQEWEP